nr:sigma 54-interacting transcriptional regulator [Biomaibacter acetigenes]
MWGKKGSYTGADRDRAGLVEKASGGILFLDEVHRLPPEGQEMLFYLIDKGMYRSLGEIDATHRARVLIICATTENLESALLRTFIRRIPMIIKLPSLRERTLSERWQLIKAFFKEEADYLKTKITVSANSIKAFLLYDCPNNIGQLKTDIKLSCARAFIQYMSNKDTGLIIHSEDLPEYVRTGLLRYKEFRQNLRQLGIGDESIVFESDGENVNTVKPSDSFNIYEALEEKMWLLKEKGLNENDINLILSLDIETFIRKYMSKLDGENVEQLYKIVDKKIVEITRNFLYFASEKMKKTFAEKILYGMSIHISSTLERIRNGKSIFNPHLDEIKKSYPVEFGVASILGRSLKENFGIDVPEDEIGFITMFLVLDDYAHKKDHARVGVIVAMHGDSTATSMVECGCKTAGGKARSGLQHASRSET